MSQPTARLAEFVATLKCDDLPAAIVDRARIALLDLLGCGLAGARSAAAQTCRAALARFGRTGGVAWGTADKLPLPWVAMANAVAARAPKMDDTHLRAKLHPGSCVIPAIFAVAEECENAGNPVSGKRVIEAMVAGYELAVRTSVATGAAEQRLRGWHATGTCGPIGAAAAISRLLAFDGDTTLSALGLGADQAAGLCLHHAGGSFVGLFHSGHACVSGILAAYMARDGFRGPIEPLAADDAGLCRALSGNCDVERLTAALGETFALLETGMKPYASCRSTHGAVQSVIALRRQHEFAPSAVQRVTVHTNRIAKMQCRHVVLSGNRVPGGSTSMAYSIAAAICDLDMGPKQLAAERMEKPDVQALAEKVDMVIDAEIDAVYPQRWPCKVDIELANGQRLNCAVANPPWEPDDHIEWTDVEQRMRHMAEGQLPADRLNEVISQVKDLRDLRSLSGLIGNLSAPA